MYHALFLVAVVVGSAFGQAPQFEAVSVKAMALVCSKCNVNNQMRMKGGPGSDDPGRIDYSGVTIQRLLVLAYNLQVSQIVGPEWLDSERFSIQAKLPADASKEQFSLMLQNLLAERFKLTLHHETREIPAYVLTVGKNGPRLQTGGFSAPPPPDRDGFAAFRLPADFQILPGHKLFITEGGRARLSVNQMSMQQLVEFMAGEMGRPVVNLTELRAKYDFTVYSTTPEDLDREERGPAVFGKMMDQLGLKLESRKMPFDVVMVDHAEKVPTEN